MDTDTTRAEPARSKSRRGLKTAGWFILLGAWLAFLLTLALMGILDGTLGLIAIFVLTVLACVLNPASRQALGGPRRQSFRAAYRHAMAERNDPRPQSLRAAYRHAMAERNEYVTAVAAPWAQGQVASWLAAVQAHPGRSRFGKGAALARVHRDAVREQIGRFTGSNVLSESRERELREVAQGLGVSIDADLEASLTCAAIRAGRLPSAAAGSIVCKPGEIVYYRVPAGVLDEVTTSRYEGGGSYGGIAIGPFRVGAGSRKGRRISTTSVDEVDRGELVITSKRLLYIGNPRTEDIPIAKIAAVEAQGGTLELHLSGRRKATRLRMSSHERETVETLIRHLTSLA